MQSCPISSSNTAQHVRQLPAPRYLMVFFFIQSIQAHVDTMQTGIGQRLGKTIQKNAVGGHPHIVDALYRSQHLRKLHNSFAHQRLTARDAYFINTHRHSYPRKFHDLIKV